MFIIFNTNRISVSKIVKNANVSASQFLPHKRKGKSVQLATRCWKNMPNKEIINNNQLKLSVLLFSSLSPREELQEFTITTDTFW
jgi:hypothetical protein